MSGPPVFVGEREPRLVGDTVSLIVGTAALVFVLLAGWALAHGDYWAFGGAAFVGLVLLRLVRWL